MRGVAPHLARYRAHRAQRTNQYTLRGACAPPRARHSTIMEQREALKLLEDRLWQAGQSIVSGIDTGDALLQASHAAELAEQEGWNKVIGIGYSTKQKRDLIYRHLANLRESLRGVTGSDPIMAKQLVDLLHARVHAGEQRRVDAATLEAQREQLLCSAVTCSLAEFMSGLHAAWGSGRYPDKVAKSMQARAAPAAPPAARTRGEELTVYCSRCARAPVARPHR